jgi:putative SOS response-associated peptidase YedK
MRAYPVSTAVSNVRNNGPELLEELEGPEEGTLF